MYTLYGVSRGYSEVEARGGIAKETLNSEMSVMSDKERLRGSLKREADWARAAGKIGIIVEIGN